MTIALFLSVLCIFAGHTPGMMEDYAIFTVNVSRVGENVVRELDYIIAPDYSIVERSQPQLARFPIATVTAPPTALATMVPRDITSDLGSSKSQAGSQVTSAESGVYSVATSAISGVQSTITLVKSGLGNAVTSAASDVHSALTSNEASLSTYVAGVYSAAETDVAGAVDKAYEDVLSNMHLSDFYSIYVSTTCSGTYIMPNGTSLTVGSMGPASPNGTIKHINICNKHTGLDPLIYLPYLYWIGVVCTVIALYHGIMGLFITSGKVAFLNVLATFPAFMFIFAASSVSSGIALGATGKWITVVGREAGFSTVGGRFGLLTWAATGFLTGNMFLWSLILYLRVGLARKQGGLLEQRKAMSAESSPYEANYPLGQRIPMSEGVRPYEGGYPASDARPRTVVDIDGKPMI